MADAEDIPDEDSVNRNLYSPIHFKDDKILEAQLFMFKSDNDRKESLVWRKYARTALDVHQIGCDKERTDNERLPEEKQRTYIGTMEAVVQQIREFKSERGHSLEVTHAPEDDQGAHHAEIQIVTPRGTPLAKNDLIDIRDELINRIFGPRVPFSCEEI